LTLAVDESRIKNWSDWLAEDTNNEDERRVRDRTYTGRPCGDDGFVKRIEAVIGRPLAPGKPGPKRRIPPEKDEPLLWTPTKMD
jgi:hypothetical protein